MTLRVVGLDLSLTGTGIAWTHNGLGQYKPGARTVSPRTDGHERIKDILLEVLDACLCHPHLVVIERLPLYDKKGDTTIRLAELHGVIKQQVWECGYPYALVWPARIKQYATGKGGGVAASKRLVTQAAQRRYTPKVHLFDDNQADAWLMVAMASDWYGYPFADLPLTHRGALREVSWPTLVVPAGQPAGTQGAILP